MSIDELKNLYTKIVYQDALDLDDDGARSVLQDLIGDEINRQRKPCEWCKVDVKKDFEVNWYDFTVNWYEFTAESTGVRPKAKFCPNCGRRLEWEE